MRSRSFAWQLSALIDNERQGRLATLLYDTLGEKGDFMGLQFFAFFSSESTNLQKCILKNVFLSIEQIMFVRDFQQNAQIIKRLLNTKPQIAFGLKFTSSKKCKYANTG